MHLIVKHELLKAPIGTRLREPPIDTHALKVFVMVGAFRDCEAKLVLKTRSRVWMETIEALESRMCCMAVASLGRTFLVCRSVAPRRAGICG